MYAMRLLRYCPLPLAAGPGRVFRRRCKAVLVAFLALYLCVPIVGGICNRIRGGWRPDPHVNFPELGNTMLTHVGGSGGGGDREHGRGGSLD